MVFAGALLIVVYFAVSIVSTGVRIRQEKRELEQLQQQIELQKALNEELLRIVESGDSERQMERIAREKLGYAQPGETVYRDMG